MGTTSISARDILTRYQTSLELNWYYGEHLADQHVIQPLSDQFQTYCGLFSQLHPHQITLFGKEEINFLLNQSRHLTTKILQPLFQSHPALVIIADNQNVPQSLFTRCRRHQIPIITSGKAAHLVMNRLNQSLKKYFAATNTLHGVFLDVLGLGVLLTGESGVGKSELALGLINNGHRLVADDAVIFSLVAPEIIIGSCPRALQDFLEVRGLGVINIRAMFGDNAVKENKRLQLVIKVVSMTNEQIRQMNRLEGIHSKVKILDIAIPEVTIPVAPGRNLAVLVEGAVRNQILRMTGYDATREFIQRQQYLIEEN